MLTVVDDMISLCFTIRTTTVPMAENALPEYDTCRAVDGVDTKDLLLLCKAYHANIILRQEIRPNFFSRFHLHMVTFTVVHIVLISCVASSAPGVVGFIRAFTKHDNNRTFDDGETRICYMSTVSNMRWEPVGVRSFGPNLLPKFGPKCLSRVDFLM